MAQTRAAQTTYTAICTFTKETAIETCETGYEILDAFTRRERIISRAAPGQRLLKLPRWLFFNLHEDLAVRILGGCSLLVLAR